MSKAKNVFQASLIAAAQQVGKIEVVKVGDVKKVGVQPVVKNAAINTLTVTPYHAAVYAACAAAHKAAGTATEKMIALLKSKYGEVAPSYLQYRADQAALASIAKDKGLKDSQWLRKPFAAAVKAVFGALPESQDPASIAKRKLRAQKAGNAPASAPVGAPKGKVQVKVTSPSESIEQAITRMGLFKVLEACTNILAQVDTTKELAKAIKADIQKVK